MSAIFDGLSAHLQKGKISQISESWLLIWIKINRKYFLKILPMIVSITRLRFMINWLMIQNVYSKMFSTSCTTAHYSTTALKLRECFKVRKSGISQKCLKTLWLKKLKKKNSNIVRERLHFSEVINFHILEQTA